MTEGQIDCIIDRIEHDLPVDREDYLEMEGLGHMSPHRMHENPLDSICQGDECGCGLRVVFEVKK